MVIRNFNEIAFLGLDECVVLFDGLVNRLYYHIIPFSNDDRIEKNKKNIFQL